MRKAVVAGLLAVACCGLMATMVFGGGAFSVKADLRKGATLPGIGYSWTDQIQTGDASSLALLVEGKFDSCKIYLDFYENANRIWRTDSLLVYEAADTNAVYEFKRFYQVPVDATGGDYFLDQCMFPYTKFRLFNMAVVDTADTVRLVLYGRER